MSEMSKKIRDEKLVKGFGESEGKGEMIILEEGLYGSAMEGRVGVEKAWWVQWEKDDGREVEERMIRGNGIKGIREVESMSKIRA